MRHRISPIGFLKQGFPLCILLASLALTQGCAEYQLKMKDSDPEHNPYISEMIHAYAWGTLYSPLQITAGCNTETGINDVVVQRNYLYDLASVLTLGIWMPIEVEYRCQAGPSETIELR